MGRPAGPRDPFAVPSRRNRACHRPSAACGLLAVLCVAHLAAFGAAVAAEPTPVNMNPTGDPVGGGEGYRHILPAPAEPVATAEALVAALAAAASGDIVYMDDAAEIDLSGRDALVIPAGVTLASGRGRGGSAGALLRTTDLGVMPLLAVGGPGVRVTGLRLRGPDPERRTDEMRRLHKQGKYYSLPNSRGIQCDHPGLVVDNCELSGWSHAAVFLRKGAAGHVHHNHIHHNQRSGLGYGVCLDRSEGLIEANRFDFCRHAIAGTGRPGTSYEARYNDVGPHANGHSFDMHGGADRGDGTDVAGDRIRIHHNTFRATTVPAVHIRGRPRVAAEIHHNRFYHASLKRAVRQSHATGGMTVEANRLGPPAETD
ncbi:MAG: right-handed parallel beta-helix repeat-containing protein [Phycisphaerae bacterium]